MYLSTYAVVLVHFYMVFSGRETLLQRSNSTHNKTVTEKPETPLVLSNFAFSIGISAKLMASPMDKLPQEVQLSIADNLVTDDLASLACASHKLCAISSTILFMMISVEVGDLAVFQAAMDVRFNACNVRSLSIGGNLDHLVFGGSIVSDAFVENLHKILKSVTQIRHLHLDITCTVNPQYPEAVLGCHFDHLEDFRYTVHGRHDNDSVTIYLPPFINSHPTLKKLEIQLSGSYHRQCMAFAPHTVITIPQLQWFAAPVGYFSCTFACASQLSKIKIKYPEDSSLRANELLQNDILLPHIEAIIVWKKWGFGNVDALATLATKFRLLRSLEIQQIYKIGHNDNGVPELLSHFSQLEIFQYGSEDSYNSEQGAEETSMISPAFVAGSWKTACSTLRRIRINSWFCLCSDKTHDIVITWGDWKS
ncbi:hypothetical protein C8R46DRAFT_1025884 [Mycena filopes]|nr:hypothetical protein C8R46DRAFT_1025884 [Mycena filopes]